jgi:transmembrane 9 superfamily protein 2/4
MMLLLAVLMASPAACLVPVMPISHSTGDPVAVNVNSLRSISHIFPFDYYQLPLCRPTVVHQQALTLGEVLWGDRVQSSAYSMAVNRAVACRVMQCGEGPESPLSADEVGRLETFINSGYRVELLIDALPEATTRSPVFCTVGELPREFRAEFVRGHLIGLPKSCFGNTVVFNHLQLHIQIAPVQAEDGAPQYRVMRFSVTPRSSDHAGLASGHNISCTLPTSGGVSDALTIEKLRSGVPLRWSYDVTWEEVEYRPWASRWDEYMANSPFTRVPQIHSFALANAALAVFFLGMIVVKAGREQLRHTQESFHDAQAAQVVTTPRMQWLPFGSSHIRQIRHDVFRLPPRLPLLAAFVGSGVQLLCLAFKVAAFGMTGIQTRGAVLTSMVLSFLVLGFFGGIACGRVLMLAPGPPDGVRWRHAALSALLLPSLLAAVFLPASLLNLAMGASSSIPIPTLLFFVAVFTAVNLGTWIAGACLSFRMGTRKRAYAVAAVATDMPRLVWYASLPAAAAIDGVLALGAAYIHQRVVLVALWEGATYDHFGVLCLTLLLWLATVTLVAIVNLQILLPPVVVAQLRCNVDWRWSYGVPSRLVLSRLQPRNRWCSGDGCLRGVHGCDCHCVGGGGGGGGLRGVWRVCGAPLWLGGRHASGQ